MVGRPKKYHTLEELKAAQKKQRAAYAKTDKSKERHKRYIQRILNDPRIDTDFETVKQIAAVIVHECTHKKEVDETGKTNEIGPKNAERQFLDFLNKPEVSKEIVQELLKYPNGSKTVGKLF